MIGTSASLDSLAFSESDPHLLVAKRHRQEIELASPSENDPNRHPDPPTSQLAFPEVSAELDPISYFGTAMLSIHDRSDAPDRFDDINNDEKT